jgi:serine protease
MCKFLSHALVLWAVLASVMPLSRALGAGETNTARVIVKFKTNSTLLREPTPSAVSRAQALALRLGVAISAGATVSERAQVVYASGMSSSALAQRLAAESDVEYVVPDERKRIVTAPNDPLYASGVPGNGPAVGQWYLRAPSGAVQSSLDIETAWSITQGDPNVVVAVVDTGVRYDHPDLLAVAAGGKLLPGYTMISDPAVANDGDGRDADASDPGDWVTAAEANQVGGPFYQCTTIDPNTGKYVGESSSWHGTQVSGLIAAITNNGIGMASVGPNLRVLPVRAVGKCGGYDSDILAGMRWAAGLAVPGVPANPSRASVINLSLGADGPCTAAYQDAVNEVTAVGSVIVASAGNSEGGAVQTPANCSGVIAVAGLRHVGSKVGFSSIGPEVAISAPAGNCVNTALGSPCLYPILTTSNSGATTPAASIYTDSYNVSLGTSFSAPLVSSTAALILSLQPGLKPQQVRVLLQSTARQFPTTSDSPGVPQCATPQFDVAGNPVAQDECICTIDTCGAGMLSAGAAVTAASSGVAAASVQAQGLWWNAPAGSESGWGINFAHQGNAIFATWFTYDLAGKAWWLSMTANKTGTSPDTYTGDLFATNGPAFSAVPFNPALVTRNVIGSGTLTFNDLNRGSFSYVVNGTAGAKSISRQAFGPVPTCTYGPQPNFASATNYQDLWWVASGAEAGWGVNLTQQGDNIFATWFTYDLDGTPLWLSMTAMKTAPGIYSGQIIQTAGPAFSASPFNPALVTRTPVGAATLTFADGNTGTFAYTVNGVMQVKQITRELFAPPAGTLCQ